MPKSRTGDGKTYGGVVKDPLDLRDLIYESGLFELPFKIDNRPFVPAMEFLASPVRRHLSSGAEGSLSRSYGFEQQLQGSEPQAQHQSAAAVVRKKPVRARP